MREPALRPPPALRAEPREREDAREPRALDLLPELLLPRVDRERPAEADLRPVERREDEALRFFAELREVVPREREAVFLAARDPPCERLDADFREVDFFAADFFADDFFAPVDFRLGMICIGAESDA